MLYNAGLFALYICYTSIFIHAANDFLLPTISIHWTRTNIFPNLLLLDIFIFPFRILSTVFSDLRLISVCQKHLKYFFRSCNNVFMKVPQLFLLQCTSLISNAKLNLKLYNSEKAAKLLFFLRTTREISQQKLRNLLPLTSFHFLSFSPKNTLVKRMRCNIYKQ